MYKTLVEAKVPFPHLMTYFVSGVEFVGGSLLTVGFLSSPACVALLVDMLVAILTTKLSAIPKEMCIRDRGYPWAPRRPGEGERICPHHPRLLGRHTTEIFRLVTNPWGSRHALVL